MKLTHLLTSKVIITRMTPGTNDRLVLSTVTAVSANIQPTSDSGNQIRDGVFGKSFRFFCSGDVDIQPNDRLRDNDTGDEYIVLPDGISHRSMGSIDYSIIAVEKTKA